MPNDSPVKTVAVTVAVAFACSVLVSGSAVVLKPLQVANKERAREQYMADIVRRLPDVEAGAKIAGLRVEARIVDLATGAYVPGVDAATYDQRRAARDPARSVALAPERDLAGIKRRAKLAVVYVAGRDGRAELVILPVHGRGFGSTVYGYLGLTGDTRTVVGFTVYEHGETPGLGALVDTDRWRDLWPGKRVWDEAEFPRLGVARGKVEAASPDAAHQVDGLTGATWTSKGITNLLQFWLGDDGFGPYLRTVRNKGG
jgi:Na+-transporting NADH:ubiquinone oxidoreductase subunit C